MPVLSEIKRRSGPRPVHRCALPPYLPKTCSLCKKDKPRSEFYLREQSVDGYGGQCKECRIRYSRIYAGKNPDVPIKSMRAYRCRIPNYKEEQREKKLIKKYGLSTEQYQAILLSQNGVCAICQKPPRPGTQLDVDHCHGSGRVRGLLCRTCNAGLGLFRDNPEMLRVAARYVSAD